MKYVLMVLLISSVSKASEIKDNEKPFFSNLNYIIELEKTGFKSVPLFTEDENIDYYKIRKVFKMI